MTTDTSTNGRRRRLTAIASYHIAGQDIHYDPNHEPQYFNNEIEMHDYLVALAAKNESEDQPVVFVACDQPTLTPLSAILVIGKEIINERRHCSIDDLLYLQDQGRSLLKAKHLTLLGRGR